MDTLLSGQGPHEALKKRTGKDIDWTSYRSSEVTFAAFEPLPRALVQRRRLRSNVRKDVSVRCVWGTGERREWGLVTTVDPKHFGCAGVALFRQPLCRR